jgi:hypothetical protein
MSLNLFIGTERGDNFFFFCAKFSFDLDPKLFSVIPYNGYFCEVETLVVQHLCIHFLCSLISRGIVRNGSELRGGLPPFRLKKRDPPTLSSEALLSHQKCPKNGQNSEKCQK